MTQAAQLASYGSNNVGLSFKNRIINGAMQIDQRNAGASVTPTVNTYTLDRWRAAVSQASKLSVQQNAGSVTLPSGFSNYLGFTSLSAYSILSNDYFLVQQKIEGFNIADLAWGTSSASPVTLSFKVYSSLTGTFGGSLQNSAQDRSYPFTYSIPVANTWTTISITVSGDTTGTWLTTNGVGIQVWFGLGVGSTYSGTAGSWAAVNYVSATSATSVVGTNGATFYITGVQLEKGSTATSFDYRPYGTELALCQRYYETNCPINTAPANGIASLPSRTLMAAYATDVIATNIPFLVQKRTTPTLTFYSGSDPAGTVSGYWSYYNGSTPAWVASTNTTLGGAVPSRFDVNVSKTASFTIAATYITQGTWAASAEL